MHSAQCARTPKHAVGTRCAPGACLFRQQVHLCAHEHNGVGAHHVTHLRRGGRAQQRWGGRRMQGWARAAGAQCREVGRVAHAQRGLSRSGGPASSCLCSRCGARAAPPHAARPPHPAHERARSVRQVHHHHHHRLLAAHLLRACVRACMHACVCVHHAASCICSCLRPELRCRGVRQRSGARCRHRPAPHHELPPQLVRRDERLAQQLNRCVLRGRSLVLLRCLLRRRCRLRRAPREHEVLHARDHGAVGQLRAARAQHLRARERASVSVCACV